MDEDVRHTIEQLAKEFRDALSGLKDHIDSKFDQLSQKYVSKESYDSLRERVVSLEADRRKVAWLVIAAVLAAVLAGVLITRISPTPTNTTTVDAPSVVPTVTVIK
jgi:uncharacterized protein YdcH (DUF465 family)